jgi:hypothetical protein
MVQGLALHLASPAGHAESFWQAETEALEQDRLGAIGAHDAAQSQFAAGRRRRRRDDVGAGDVGEFLEERARTVAETGAVLPLLQRLPQHVGQKTHQDVPQPRLSARDPRRLQAQKSLKKILAHTNCGSWARELEPAPGAKSAKGRQQ